MDTFLKDLQQWKIKREENQESDEQEIGITAGKDEYECVDAEYMKDALEREEALLAKLNTIE